MREFYCRPYIGGGYGSGNGLSYANAFNGFGGVDWDAINAVKTEQNVLRIAGYHGSGSLNSDATLIPVIDADHQYQTRITGLAFNDSGVADPGSIMTITTTYSGTSGWTDLGGGIYSRSLTGSNSMQVFEGSTTLGLSVSRMTRMLLPPSEDAAGWAAATGAFFAERTNNSPVTVYVKPTNALASTRLYIGNISNAVQLDNVSNLLVDNLSLYGASYAGIRLRNCVDVTLRDNLIKWVFRATIADSGFYTTRMNFIHNTVNNVGYGLQAIGAVEGLQKNSWNVRFNTIDDVDSDAYYGHIDAHGILLEGASDHHVLFNRINRCAGASLMLDFYQGNTQHRNWIGDNLIENAQSAQWYSFGIKWVRENATTLRANNNPGSFTLPVGARVRVRGATTAAFEAEVASLTTEGTDKVLVLQNLGGTINADPFISVEMSLLYYYNGTTYVRYEGGIRQQIENTNYDPNNHVNNFFERNLVRNCVKDGFWLNCGNPTTGFTFQLLDNYVEANGNGLQFQEVQPSDVGFRAERNLFKGNTRHILHVRQSTPDGTAGVTMNNNYYVDDGAAKFRQTDSGVATDRAWAAWKSSNAGGWDAASKGPGDSGAISAPVATSLINERANMITAAIANEAPKTVNWS